MRRGALWHISTLIFVIFTPVLAIAAVNNVTRPRFSDDTVTFYKVETYTVKPGDTLWGLAKKLHVDVTQLIAWNDVTSPEFLQVGDIIQYESTSTDGQAYAESKRMDTQTTSAPAGALAYTSPLSGRGDDAIAYLPKDAKLLLCTLTAYTAGPESTGKAPGDPGYDLTSTGVRAVQGITVAVDPTVIPYGTKLFIPGVGFRVAEDTGGAIVGNHIDVFFNDLSVAQTFGVKHDVPIYILPSWFEVPDPRF